MHSKRWRFLKVRNCYFRLACRAILSVALPGIAAALDAQPATSTAVIPIQYRDVPGDGGQILFNYPSAVRYQCLYDAADFATAMPAGGTIVQLAIRLDETDRSSFEAVIPDLEIRMSTSPASSANISHYFSKNVGPDETVVFPRSEVHVVGQGSASGPNQFQVIFPLAHPFLYDPRRGSLVVDFFDYKPGTGHPLTIDTGGAIALVGGLVVPNVDHSDTILGAPVIQLNFFPVPEPGPCAVICASLIVGWLFRIVGFL